jgi:predicted GIY-YIG superfamily endonuclease
MPPLVASRRRAYTASAEAQKELRRMCYVYILRSERSPKQTYVGSTTDLEKRVAEHNAGKSTHTNKFKPWRLEAYVAFPKLDVAEGFERYLKTGSGRAFAKRHLLTPGSSLTAND